MIDSHLHFWSYQASEFPWISDAMGVLKQDFLPQHFFAAINEPIEAVVAVQSRTSWEDNHFLATLAQHDAHIAAVVGWFDFNADVSEQLAWSKKLPAIKGFRHLIQDEADPSAYLNHHQGLNQAMSQLQAASYVYEVLVHQRDLAAAVAFCQRHDEHYLVIDHLAKPVFGDESAFEQWQQHMQALAALPHVVVKVSGLETEIGSHCRVQDLHAHVHEVHQLFGAERLLWGSNWPVCQLTHSYQAVWQHGQTLTETWTASEQAQLFAGTAQRIYQINHTENNIQRSHHGFAVAK